MSFETYVEILRAAWEAAEERMFNADLAAKRRLLVGDDTLARELVTRIERFTADMHALTTPDPAQPEAP